MILHLEEEGIHMENQGEIQETIYRFYNNLFGKQPDRKVHLEQGVWAVSGRLSLGDNDLLKIPFSEEEVHKVIRGLKANSAPGPDGFSYAFYKCCWESNKGDFMRMVDDFYWGKLGIQRLNYGVITLIPKVKDAFNVRQFRPICLLNVSFKIFSNLLMNRLSRIDDKIVDKGQTAFIKGRYILDGVVILHETLHVLRRRKLRGVILKIDFEKAYDSVKWEFVEEVMRRKGFDDMVIG